MDKQIIIDGIDVSGCEYYDKNKPLLTCVCEEYPCSECHNCYYKQLKRKEQECEELKKAQKNSRCAWKSLERTFCPEAQEQLDKLKAELTRANCQIADDEILQCDMREAIEELNAELEQEKALKETYLTCYKAKHNDIEGKLFKLKQTLTEIKEIAKKQIPYHDFEKLKTFIELEYDYAGKVYDLEQRMHKILQKISESEEQ